MDDAHFDARTAPDEPPPPIGFVLIVAGLGVFPGRGHDAFPGPMRIDLQRSRDMVRAIERYEAAGSATKKRPPKRCV